MTVSRKYHIGDVSRRRSKADGQPPFAKYHPHDQQPPMWCENPERDTMSRTGRCGQAPVSHARWSGGLRCPQRQRQCPEAWALYGGRQRDAAAHPQSQSKDQGHHRRHVRASIGDPAAATRALSCRALSKVRQSQRQWRKANQRSKNIRRTARPRKMPVATPSTSAQKSDMSADLPKTGWMASMIPPYRIARHPKRRYHFGRSRAVGKMSTAKATI